MMVAASAGVADSGILVVAVVVKIIIGSLGMTTATARRSGKRQQV